MVSCKGTHFPPEVILPCVRWLEETLHRRKRPVWISWRLDETSLKVQGQWRELSRAVEKHGQTMDFLLTAPREKAAALRCLKKAMGRPGVPEQLTLDGSEANASALQSDNEEPGTSITLRQVKYLTNLVEQDHRGGKRVPRPMLGFTSFEAAQSTLTGIELMHMLKKRQMEGEEGEGLTAAEQFYALASQSLCR